MIPRPVAFYHPAWTANSVTSVNSANLGQVLRITAVEGLGDHIKHLEAHSLPFRPEMNKPDQWPKTIFLAIHHFSANHNPTHGKRGLYVQLRQEELNENVCERRICGSIRNRSLAIRLLFICRSHSIHTEETVFSGIAMLIGLWWKGAPWSLNLGSNESHISRT